MIGYSVKHEDIANFRIDRMTNVSVSDKSKYVCQRDFDLKEYLQAKIKVFKGVRTEVCLKCKSKHMKAILDYFGHGIKTTNSEKGYFNAGVEIELSPTFYAWIFQFEGDIIIQSPQKAIDDFIKTAEIIIEAHSK
jgi:predicted DNA-binding transcriptional regulator YafY